MLSLSNRHDACLALPCLACSCADSAGIVCRARWLSPPPSPCPSLSSSTYVFNYNHTLCPPISDSVWVAVAVAVFNCSLHSPVRQREVGREAKGAANGPCCAPVSALVCHNFANLWCVTFTTNETFYSRSSINLSASQNAQPARTLTIMDAGPTTTPTPRPRAQTPNAIIKHLAWAAVNLFIVCV